MSAARPGVLMIVGAYYPEMSGAGLQCRTLMGSLRDRVDFTVLTTTADRRLPVVDSERGVPVYRVFVDPTSLVSKTLGAVRFAIAFFRTVRRFSLVHMHGFSQKSLLIVILSRLTGKKIAIKLTSFGDDDPVSIARRSWWSAWCYRRADMFFAVSPRFRESYDAAGLPAERYVQMPNGVDVQRFRPPVTGERAALRRQLGLPDVSPVVLFVGFFSRDKQPDLLFDAWAELALTTAPSSVLVLVGATRSVYHEVDPTLAERIRAEAGRRRLTERVHFIESTHEIERFYRAADVFVLPSLREGMPNALLEAMASGAACIATRLPGITDQLIDDNRSGILTPVGDRAALLRALTAVTADPALGARMGAEARRTIVDGYSLERIAGAYANAYNQLLSIAPCAA